MATTTTTEATGPKVGDTVYTGSGSHPLSKIDGDGCGWAVEAAGHPREVARDPKSGPVDRDHGAVLGLGPVADLIPVRPGVWKTPRCPAWVA